MKHKRWHYFTDPTVCYNKKYTLPSPGGSGSNETLTVTDACFVCPDGADPTQSECCGDQDSQRCCAYFDE